MIFDFRAVLLKQTGITTEITQQQKLIKNCLGYYTRMNGGGLKLNKALRTIYKQAHFI